MKIIKNSRNALSNLSKLRFINLFINKTRKIAIKGMSSKLIPKKFKPKKAILTNLHSDLDYSVLNRMLPKNIEPAYDGLTVNF